MHGRDRRISNFCLNCCPKSVEMLNLIPRVSLLCLQWRQRRETLGTRLWKCYVDNSFCIIKKDPSLPQRTQQFGSWHFLHYWTIEQENNDQIPFLHSIVIIFISLHILRIFTSFIVLPVEDHSSSGRKLAIFNIFSQRMPIQVFYPRQLQLGSTDSRPITSLVSWPMTSMTGVLIASTDVTQITWLRLSKRQSMSSQADLLRTTLTWMIILYFLYSLHKICVFIFCWWQFFLFSINVTQHFLKTSLCSSLKLCINSCFA